MAVCSFSSRSNAIDHYPVLGVGTSEALNHRPSAAARAVMNRWSPTSVKPTQPPATLALPRAMAVDSLPLVQVSLAAQDCSDRQGNRVGQIAGRTLTQARPHCWPLAPLTWLLAHRPPFRLATACRAAARTCRACLRWHAGRWFARWLVPHWGLVCRVRRP